MINITTIEEVQAALNTTTPIQKQQLKDKHAKHRMIQLEAVYQKNMRQSSHAAGTTHFLTPYKRYKRQG